MRYHNISIGVQSDSPRVLGLGVLFGADMVGNAEIRKQSKTVKNYDSKVGIAISQLGKMPYLGVILGVVLGVQWATFGFGEPPRKIRWQPRNVKDCTDLRV